MNEKQSFMFGEYRVDVSLNTLSIGEYLGISVNYSHLPNPYSSSVSALIEKQAVEQFGKEGIKTVVCWGHDPSMSDKPQGRFATVTEAIKAMVVEAANYPRFHGYVYQAVDGSFDVHFHHEDRYINSFIGAGSNLLIRYLYNYDGSKRQLEPFSSDEDFVRTWVIVQEALTSMDLKDEE